MNKNANYNASIEELRARISSAVTSLDKPSAQLEWWLLGTVGCHLCTEAENLMTCFQAVQPITYQHVDIADFDERLMMAFATSIPVLLTPSKRLNYPFSVMDMQQLIEEEDKRRTISISNVYSTSNF
ncbi:glutaredoxin family protein [Psychrobacter sp. CAL346-MNA-CIBAN-0220]|uniref:glutaredoxin family protein n=1 Tax=Psychrobacter sp. CAL346-MNA-CIBAN-0220 TaxID=3140457 RepID=UPI00331E818F